MLDHRDRFKHEVESNKIERLKSRGLIPDSYHIHDSLILLPYQTIIDTTERATVSLAAGFRFDPEGYDLLKPLERELFRSESSLTCTLCNGITFINAAIVRRGRVAPNDSEERLPHETAAECAKCGRGDGLVFGVHDFSNDIAQRTRYLKSLPFI